MSEQLVEYRTEPQMELVPQMVMTVEQAVARLKEFQRFVDAVMVKDVDYGIIPGTDKPTLLKPGAEKLCEMYGLAPVVTVTHRIEDWEKPFFHYECRCELLSKRTGNIVAVGVGSCNSRERRYADRWVFASEIPAGIDRDGLQRREFTGRDGKRYVKYLWHNEDIYTLVNTILKMAKKRALIDATLSATRSSGMFTQDIEDWVEPERSNGNHKPAPAQPDRPQPSAPQRPTRISAQDPERQALLQEWGRLWNEMTGLNVKPTITVSTSAPIDELREAVEQLRAEVEAAREIRQGGRLV